MNILGLNAYHGDASACLVRDGEIIYFFRTPNIYHYVSLIGRFSPHRFHNAIANRVRGLPDEVHESWPTYC